MKFDLIMICPPWKHFNRFRTRCIIRPDNTPPKLNRSTMAFEFIQQILRNFTQGDHLVFVWVPGKFTSDYREYIASLAYTPHGSFMCIRPKWKIGSDKKTAEFLQVFHIGNLPKLSDHYIKMADSHFPGAVKTRLEKPGSAYEFLEEEFPRASKLQVYGYTNRPGWTVIHRNDDKIK